MSLDSTQHNKYYVTLLMHVENKMKIETIPNNKCKLSNIQRTKLTFNHFGETKSSQSKQNNKLSITTVPKCETNAQSF